MLIEIIPYILGAAVSPLLLATAVLLLAQPQKPIFKTLAFALGGTLAATIIGSVIFFVLPASGHPGRPSISDSVAHIIIGIVLIILSYKVWHKTKKPTKKVSKKVHYGRDVLLGAGLMMTNFTSLIMFVPAGLELQHSDMSVRLTGLVLLIFASTLAMWLPLILVATTGKAGRNVLAKMSKFMNKHGQQVSGGLIGLIALYVLYKGISGL